MFSFLSSKFIYFTTSLEFFQCVKIKRSVLILTSHLKDSDEIIFMCNRVGTALSVFSYIKTCIECALCAIFLDISSSKHFIAHNVSELLFVHNALLSV